MVHLKEEIGPNQGVTVVFRGAGESGGGAPRKYAPIFALNEGNRCARLPEPQGSTGMDLPDFVCKEFADSDTYFSVSSTIAEAWVTSGYRFFVLFSVSLPKAQFPHVSCYGITEPS